MYLCQEKQTGLRLAAKFVSCSHKEDRKNMEREIEIMSGLHHPKLIQLYDAFDEEKRMSCFLELWVYF